MKYTEKKREAEKENAKEKETKSQSEHWNNDLLFDIESRYGCLQWWYRNCFV